MQNASEEQAKNAANYSTPPTGTGDSTIKGRPDSYTEERAAILLEKLVNGDSLRTACKADGMPTPNTVFLWMYRHPEFRERYQEAAEARASAFAEDILDISDDASNDWMVDNYPKGKTPGYELMGEHIQRSKLRVDTRWRLMRAMQPRVYGEKLDLTSKGKEFNPVPILPAAQLKKPTTPLGAVVKEVTKSPTPLPTPAQVGPAQPVKPIINTTMPSKAPINPNANQDPMPDTIPVDN